MPNIKEAIEAQEAEIQQILDRTRFFDRDSKPELKVHLKQIMLLYMLAEQKGGAENEYTEEDLQPLKDSDWYKDPLFDEALDTMHTKNDVLTFTKQPSSMTDAYEMTKRAVVLTNRFNEVLNKDGYNGLVNFMVDTCTQNGEEWINSGSTRRFVKQLVKMPKEGEELSPEVELYAKALSEKFGELILQADKIKEQNKKDIQDGKYPEFSVYADDPEAVEEMAHLLMYKQSDVGKKLFALSVITQVEFMQQIGDLQLEHVDYKGKKVAEYFNALIKNGAGDYVKDHGEPELAKKVYNRDYFDGYYNGPGRKPVKGFTVAEFPKPGEPVFAKVPAEITKVINMSEPELLLFEQKKLSRKAFEDDFKKDTALVKKFSDSVEPLIEEMQQLDLTEEQKQSPQYKSMLDEMKNFQWVGTTRYQRAGVIGGAGAAYANETGLTPYYMKNALQRLEAEAVAFQRIDPGFSDKVQGFIWSQRQNYKNYMNDPDHDIKMDIVQGAKKAKGIADQKKTNHDLYVSRLKEMPNKYNTAKQKYDNAKLMGGLRGSSQYREIGEALEKLQNQYDFMVKREAYNRGLNNGNMDYDTMYNIRSNMLSVQEEIEKLKEKTAKYFEHKVKDGQWKKGTNANADKRIEAVQSVNEFADFLEETLTSKLRAMEPMMKQQKQLEIAEQRKKLEAKVPDLETWKQLYPHNTSYYQISDREVPYGVKEFENKIQTANGFLMNTHHLIPRENDREQMVKLNELAKNSVKLSMLMAPGKDLETSYSNGKSWNDEVSDTLETFKKQICEGDNFNQIAEAAERYGSAANEETYQQMLRGLNAVNDIFKLDIPVAKLEQQYELYKQKQAFKDQAAEVYIKNIHREKVEEYCQKHHLTTPEQKQQIYDANPISKEWFNKTKAELLNSDSFNEYMHSIKTAEDLAQAKQMAETNNGTELYDYIRLGKTPVNLDEKLKNAQTRLTELKKDLRKKEYPEIKKVEKDYAEITAVYLLKRQAEKAPGKQITFNDYHSAVERLRQEEFFKKTLLDGKLTAKDLFNKATTGNGKDLYYAASTAQSEYKAQKAKAEQVRVNMEMHQEQNLHAENKGLEGPN